METIWCLWSKDAYSCDICSFFKALFWIRIYYPWALFKRLRVQTSACNCVCTSLSTSKNTIVSLFSCQRPFSPSLLPSFSGGYFSSLFSCPKLVCMKGSKSFDLLCHVTFSFFFGLCDSRAPFLMWQNKIMIAWWKKKSPTTVGANINWVTNVGGTELNRRNARTVGG